MKKAIGLILLGMMSLAASGCRAETTETTTHDITRDPIVGFWVVPVGESIPTYYTDFLDPWAFKIYLDIDEAGTAVDLVGGTPFYDLSGETKEFVDVDGESMTGYRLAATLRVLMEGTTFGVAFIHRDAAGFLHPGTLNGYYFPDADAVTTISLVQVLADYAIDLELRFEAAPRIANVTVSMFAADHTEIRQTGLSLSDGLLWSIEAEEAVAYVVFEETREDGFIQRTLYSRVDGGMTGHAVFLLSVYGLATARTCVITWNE
ncbi:MAG TPA: hypothetical protein DCR44_07060 [Acholeplasmatales bacterium]|nr:MAG: hypothetical protein A2Y16_02575 [Tenericutes bacterium GWF2_57_13]HAQ57133.1 hypothetical protein [Acholeplasmatales bacterium]